LGSLPQTVRVLALASFLRDIASEMIIHLLPLYLFNVLGARTAVVGLIEGLAETTSALTKIASGWLSDRVGRRKGLTVAGYSLAALAMPLLLIARAWPMVLAYRFVDRLGKGIRTAPRDALLADAVREDQRGAAFGLHRAADSAGAFVGLLLAIGLVWWAQGQGGQLQAGAFRAVLLWALIPGVLAALVIAVGLKERNAPSAGATIAPAGPAAIVPEPQASVADALEDAAPAASRKALLEVSKEAPPDAPQKAPLADPRFRAFLTVMLLFTLGNSSDAFLVLRAQAAGASVVGILGMLACFNLVYALAAAPAGRRSDRGDRRRTIIAGWLIYALVYLGFALATEVWMFWLLFGVYGLYYAQTEGVAKALVADLIPPARRGTAYGLYNAAVGLGALPASLLGGLLWQGIGGWAGFGPAAPFAFGAGLALVSAILLWRLPR
jgi:MFS family permease